MTRGWRALSFTQPWLWCVLNLGKRCENRSRNLGHYRGTLLLHASKGMTLSDWWSAYDFVAARFPLGLADEIPQPQALVRGAIVGVCEVVNQCAPGPAWLPHNGPRGNSSSIPASWYGDQERWYMGAHAYVFDDVRELTAPIPCKGALGLWTPPADVVERVLWQLCAFRDDHDPVTEEPRGNACGRVAAAILHWHDGRKSPMCEQHGMRALTPEARELVVSVEQLNLGGDP